MLEEEDETFEMDCTNVSCNILYILIFVFLSISTYVNFVLEI